MFKIFKVTKTLLKFLYRLCSQLNQTALVKAQELYEATPQTNRRQTHAAIQERVNTLLVDIRLYEKGLKLFPSDTQSQLVKYLLKSLGNDICNELTLYVAAECSLSVKSTNLNVEQRIKLVQECGKSNNIEHFPDKIKANLFMLSLNRYTISHCFTRTKQSIEQKH